MFRLVKSISTPNVQALGEDSQILERIRSEIMMILMLTNITTMVTQGAGIGQMRASIILIRSFSTMVMFMMVITIMITMMYNDDPNHQGA